MEEKGRKRRERGGREREENEGRKMGEGGGSRGEIFYLFIYLFM